MKRLLILPLALILAAPGLRAQQPGAAQPTPAPGKQPAARRPPAQPADTQPSDAESAAAADSIIKLVRKGAIPAAAMPKGVLVAPDLAGLVDEWLRGPATGKQAADRLDYVRTWLGPELLRRQFIGVAGDTTQPALVRARALIALGAEHPTGVAAFDYALSDADPTVRAAAAVGLKPVLGDPKVERAALAELRRALRDPSPVVVSRALDALGDRDPAALRAFLATGPQKPLATVAQQLLDLAEARGAALVPRDSSGLLARSTAGTLVEFVPAQRWPQWEIAVGTLRVRRGSGAPVVLASAVEVVRNALPAVVSGDGNQVAYESAGHVHLRDLQSGADRDLGPGIAPRSTPMASGFLFARAGPVATERDHDSLQYALVFVPWAGGEPRELGKATAYAKQLVNGNASGMRWARIVEGDGIFILTGDGLAAPVTLPDLATWHG